MEFLVLLSLVIIANSIPVLAKDIFGDRLAYPVDCGTRLSDGQPLLGKSKTFRGLLLTLLLTPPAALLLGLDLVSGLLIGAGAMFGDLLSSFCKRRMKLPPSSRAIFLDQLPESLVPMFLLMWHLQISWVMALSVGLVFMALEMLTSPLLYRLGLRDRPY